MACSRIDPTPAPLFTSRETQTDPFYQAFLKDQEKPLATQPASGVLTGTMVWQGPLSGDRAWLAPLSPLIQRQNTPVEPRPNPFFPRIAPTGQGGPVEGVVVALIEGPVRPQASWRHGPTKLVLRKHLMAVEQDGKTPMVGFLKWGEPIDMSLESGDFDTITGRGAAFFSVPFLKPGDSSQRKPVRPGVVDLASGAGHFWMRSTLIVSDQPFLTRTDEQGRFRFEGVPEGDWQLLCFRPNHLVLDRERDGESMETYLVRMKEPLVAKFPVRMGKELTRVDLSASMEGFATR